MSKTNESFIIPVQEVQVEAVAEEKVPAVHGVDVTVPSQLKPPGHLLQSTKKSKKHHETKALLLLPVQALHFSHVKPDEVTEYF